MTDTRTWITTDGRHWAGVGVNGNILVYRLVQGKSIFVGSYESVEIANIYCEIELWEDIL